MIGWIGRFALALAAGTMAAATTAPALTGALTADQWRQDLHVLAAQIEKVHPRPFHQVTRSDFEAAVAKLDASIPSMSDAEIEVAFARLVAMLGEGHSRLTFAGLPDPMSDVPQIDPVKDDHLAFHRLPLKLYDFSDGVFVTETTPALKDFIGAEVLAIDGHPTLDVFNALKPIINRDNDMGARLIAPDLATVPEVLQALHLSDDQAGVSLSLRLRDGTTRSLTLPPMATGADPAWVKPVTDAHALAALSDSHPEQNLWVRYLTGSHTVFVRINVIQDMPKQTVAQFAAKLDAASALGPVDRVVIDLRGCRGGDNQKFRAILLELVRNRKLDGTGAVFVLIDRGVFSAAVNSASDLERLVNVIFVGEPTAGAPNSWGDPHRIVLPNSGLIARVSTVYWRDWTNDETRSTIAPDLSTPLASGDYFSGRDPALATVMAFPLHPSFETTLVQLVKSGAGMGTVLRLYYQHKTDPALVSVSTTTAMEGVGEAFLARKAYAEAFTAFAINAHDDPRSLATARAVVETARKTAPSEPGLADLQQKLEHLTTH
ncbi:MAG TPA: hypothetical protein VGL66_07450 [Caulobacteraceae bacterium]|jgi:hypothetical protein